MQGAINLGIFTPPESETHEVFLISSTANKTAYYSFYLPVALAMRMAGYKDAEMFRQTKTILMEVGNFFQAQDDFIDCFGDPGWNLIEN